MFNILKKYRSLKILILAISIFFVVGCSISSEEQPTTEMVATTTEAVEDDTVKDDAVKGEAATNTDPVQETKEEAAVNTESSAEKKRTGWYWEDGERYYAFESGNMAQGPTKLEGRYFIFDLEGRLVEEDTIQEALGNVPVNMETASGDFNSAGGGNDYDDHTIYGLGGYEVTDSDREMLQAAIDELEEYYTVGFMMINLYTGEGVAYNPDADYYSASAIKGPYVASLVSAKPELKDSMKNTLSEIVMYSENEEYSNLRRTQGGVCLSDWYAASGIDSSAFTNYNYPRVSARILAKLWVHNYYFFNTDENGMAIRDWYVDPINSAIDFSIGNSSTRIESKAGWICEDKYIASNDAGIIYPSKGAPYIISICSDVPSNLERLEPLCRILRNIYEETN